MDDVREWALMKGLAGVTRLAAGFASGVFTPQGFGFALQSVAGGRLAAVGAVHVEALFELRDTSHKLLDAGLKLGEKLTNGIESTRIESSLDYRTQGFGSVAQHWAVINTQEIA
jgi:hypothetical protein